MGVCERQRTGQDVFRGCYSLSQRQNLKNTLQAKVAIAAKPETVKCAQVQEEETEDTFAYTYEKPTVWTPYNSNLHMQGIKVYVKDPQPTSTKKVDTTENALFLMDMLRDMKRKENEEKKEQYIRDMAMAKKNKIEEEKRKNHFI